MAGELDVSAPVQVTIPEKKTTKLKLLNVVLDQEHRNVRVMYQKGQLDAESAFEPIGDVQQYVFEGAAWTAYKANAAYGPHANLIKSMLKTAGIL